MKKLAALFILCFSILVFTQNDFIPTNIQKAITKGTRSLDGKPGKNYWQNSSDYKIHAKFDPLKKILQGNETIVYYNNSPDSLDELVVRLYPNFYKSSSARNFRISPESVTDGVELLLLEIDGKQVNLDNRSAVNFTNTNMIIKLLNKISPKSSSVIKVNWKYDIPLGPAIRTGMYDSTIFLIAYWYPQISVYDDIDGWDKIDFNGEQEMYNDFNNYDVELELPNTYLVWATGELENPQDIFSQRILEKYYKAKLSDSVINIIKKEDYEIGGIVLPSKEKIIWKFKANNVTDFAFGCSDRFLWDAVSLKPDKNSDRRVFISAAYREESKDFYEVAQIAKESLEYFSTDLPAVPYPYPSFTVFNGGGGMEFPMIINDESTSSKAATVGLTSHEAAHTYFPFYMGINEKKYAWMDEGMAVMLPFKFQEQVEGNDPVGRNASSYSLFAGSEWDMPPITPSILLRGTSYRMASYQRPGLAYQFLQEILGRDLFRSALNEYMRRWNGKHPIPNDFFNTFEDYLQMDLSWFWKPWFYEKAFPDLAVKAYKKKDNFLEIEIEKVGNIPVPIKISFYNQDKNLKEIYFTADVWKDGNKTYLVKIDNPPSFDEMILGDVKIPDVNKNNNEVLLK